MQSELPRAILTELDEYAATLRSHQADVPVLLRVICQKLGISVLRDEQVPSGKAYLAWDRGTQSAPTILLPSKRNDRWDRFCAAHELGHYFLVSQHEWIPVGSKAYWQTEDLCDHFARKLLLPEDRLRERLRGLEDAPSYLARCEEIAATSITPWKEVATAISGSFPVIFFGLEPSNRPGGLRVASSSLPKRAGNKAEIAADSEVVKVLTEAMEQAKSKRAAKDLRLEARLFVGTRLNDTLRRLRVSELTARIWPSARRIKIAAVLSAA